MRNDTNLLTLEGYMDDSDLNGFWDKAKGLSKKATEKLKLKKRLKKAKSRAKQKIKDETKKRINKALETARDKAGGKLNKLQVDTILKFDKIKVDTLKDLKNDYSKKIVSQTNDFKRRAKATGKKIVKEELDALKEGLRKNYNEKVLAVKAGDFDKLGNLVKDDITLQSSSDYIEQRVAIRKKQAQDLQVEVYEKGIDYIESKTKTELKDTIKGIVLDASDKLQTIEEPDEDSETASLSVRSGISLTPSVRSDIIIEDKNKTVLYAVAGVAGAVVLTKILKIW